MTGCSPLLPTPNAWDGQRGPDYARARKGPGREQSGGDDLTTVAFKLLPTPVAQDAKNATAPPSQAQRNGPGLPSEVMALLPTPSATPYGNNQSPSPNAAVRPSLDGVVKLLPTPTKGEGQGARSLTAPARQDGSRFDPGMTLTDLAFPWELNGASTSPRSDGGKPRSPGLLLNPCFVEWMLGLPAGWSDPDCPLSATEFKCRLASSWDGT